MVKIPIQLSANVDPDTEQPDDLIVGIDLGTTNSLICYIDDEGEPSVIAHPQHGHIIPSIIYFDDDNHATVGEVARSMATIKSERTIFSVKRLMGKSYHDQEVQASSLAYQLHDHKVDDLVRIQIGDQYHTPISLSALILSELKAIAESQLDRPVRKAVITVPAYFDDAQRQATKDAGRLAGLEVLRIVNEPTAASLAYGYLPDSAAKKIAVYDLGGGTFDLSILELTGGIFDVLATHGDTYLGGDDIDESIVAWLIAEHGCQSDPSLRWDARSLKHQLSTSSTAHTTIQGRDIQLKEDDLRQLIQPILDTTFKLFDHSLRDAGLSIEDIDDVLLVGGSTRMPLVRSAVAEHTGRQPNTSINPDTVVAIGAAVQADILAGNRKDLLLLDVTPLSLGIETMGGLMDVLLPRNSKIPSAVNRSYTTSVDGQISLKVAVYQGERDLVAHNRKLGEFTLRDIPPMPAGIPKIEVSFLIDADGILQVAAKELRSGQSQTIQIRPSYGLSEVEMAKMLMASIEHAESDMQVRALKEAQNEGQQLILATNKFIDQNQDWLSPSQLEDIQHHLSGLVQSVPKENKDAILAAIDTLNHYTRPLAEIAMDRQIQLSLSGRHTEDIG